jgi:hypothetical protein
MDATQGKKRKSSGLTHRPIWRGIEARKSRSTILLVREEFSKEHHVVMHVRTNTIVSSVHTSIFFFFDRWYAHDSLDLRVLIEARGDLLLLGRWDQEPVPRKTY